MNRRKPGGSGCRVFSFLDPVPFALQSTHMTQPSQQFNLEAVMEVLRRTPQTLDALLRGISDGWLIHNEGGDSWSPYDVVGHLVHGEHKDWITRARTILEQGETRTFDQFDRTAMFRESKGKSIAQLLDEFALLRRDNLALLESWNLSAADYARKGAHPAFGPVTLAELLSTWAVHDLSHTAQICRVMAKQYSEAVGPWKEYLPLLSK